MTEKWIIKNGEIVDTTNNMTFDSFMEIIIVLNGQSRHLTQMSKEIEQLTQDIKMIEERADKVYDKNEHIKKIIQNYNTNEYKHSSDALADIMDILEK